MKILFDATVFEIPFTGIAKSTLYLYENCLKINHSIDFNGFIKEKTYSQLPDNVKLHKLNKKYFEKIYSKNTINRIIDTYKPNIIHFPWCGNIPSKFKNIKTVMTLHDVLPLEIPNFFGNRSQKNKYLRKVQSDIDKSDVIFTDSNYSKYQITKNFKVKNKIVVNYFAATIPSNQDKSFRSLDYQYFIYVGGYSSRKGLDSLIKAFFMLYDEKRTKSKLLFTGIPSPISKDFDRLIIEGKRLGIIEEKGYVSDQELAELLTNAVGLVYLSKYEGFGLPPLEAMSAGCPVITTKYSSIPEICGDAAMYVDPDNITEVAKIMELLEKDTQLRNECKVKGISQSLLFSWEKTANIFLTNILER